MDIGEIFFIAFEALIAGVCFTLGGMVAEALVDRLFPSDDAPDEQEPPAPRAAPKPARKPPKKRPRIAFLPLLAMGILPFEVGCAGGPQTVLRVPEYPVTVECLLPEPACEHWSPENIQTALDLWVVAVGDTYRGEQRIPELPDAIRIENKGDLGPGFGTEHSVGLTEQIPIMTAVVAGLSYREPHGLLPMWRTALGHEMAHIMFWKELGDPDYNHQDPPGPWTSTAQELLVVFNAQLALALGDTLEGTIAAP